MAIDANAVAQELIDAYEAGDLLPAPLSSRDGFDLAAAYAVEAELARRRRAGGRTIVGRKVAFGNHAVLDKLHTEVEHIFADPAMLERMQKSGLFPVSSKPAEFDAFIRSETARWSKVIGENKGLRLE